MSKVIKKKAPVFKLEIARESEIVKVATQACTIYFKVNHKDKKVSLVSPQGDKNLAPYLNTLGNEIDPQKHIDFISTYGIGIAHAKKLLKLK